MNARLSVAALFACVLAACGGGGGSVAPVSGSNPGGGGGGGTLGNNRASATLTFTSPREDTSSQSASSKRSPQYISPGLDKMTLIVDGTKLLSLVELSTLTNNAGGPTQTFTSPDGNTTVSFSVTATGAYYTYVATIDTLPGKHTIGLEILGANPAIVLSEAQQSYTLLPGTNSPATLTLLGVLATSYVECANGPVDATDCQSSFTPGTSPGTGSYQLTAVGADFDGFPIVNQNVSFDNGPFTVVESDNLGILNLTNAGPFSSPGSQLLGNSGGYYVSGTAPYGQSFNASCLKTGTATVALTTTHVGPVVPLTGETYTYFDPSNNFPTSGNYPNAGTLATGSKTPGNPVYHGGNNPNPVTNLASISCDANLSLTVN